MKLKILPLLIGLLVLLFSFSCRPHHTPAPTLLPIDTIYVEPALRLQDIVLYDKPTDTVDRLIQGIWRVIFMRGGIAGFSKYDKTKYYQYYEFKNNRFKYIYNKNMLYADSIYTWEKWVTPEYTHNLISTYSFGGVPLTMEPFQIIHDTLALAYPAMSSPDFAIEFLIKIK